MSKGQRDNTNNATKSSITQRLRTDLGWSVEETTATQLVWLTGLRAQPSHANSAENGLKMHHLHPFFKIFLGETPTPPPARG